LIKIKGNPPNCDKITYLQYVTFVSKNEAWLENAIERKKKKFEKYDISDDEKNRLINLAKEYLPGTIPPLSLNS